MKRVGLLGGKRAIENNIAKEKRKIELARLSSLAVIVSKMGDSNRKLKVAVERLPKFPRGCGERCPCHKEGK